MTSVLSPPSHYNINTGSCDLERYGRAFSSPASKWSVLQWIAVASNLIVTLSDLIDVGLSATDIAAS